MSSILLVSHLGLATGMKKASEFILGEQENFYALELTDLGIEDFKKRVNKIKDQLGDSIILISDINYGSPGIAAYSIISKVSDVKFISGMNLPLVIELLISKNSKKLLNDTIKNAKSAIELLEFTDKDDTNEF